MPKPLPIYVVRNSTNYARLVRAPNKAQALAHVVRSEYRISVAGPDDLVNLVGIGTAVETAGDPDTVPALQADPADVERIAAMFRGETEGQK
jgi:hypothetical protein